MFSILVSELTPELLAKAEWWRFYYVMEGNGIQWADTRHRSGIDAPFMDPKQSIVIAAPTPNHYPRLTLEGAWVWSTRR